MGYKSKYAGKEVDKRLDQGTYDDAVLKGFAGTKDEFDSNLSKISSIPSKTSQLTNDSNFVVDENYIHTDNNFTKDLKNKLDRLNSYSTVSTLYFIGADDDVLYASLTSNVTLEMAFAGAQYNGRSVTVIAYCKNQVTIVIPTTGAHVSMCGSSYTCPAGKWVEFNLTCVDGKWHIAKLEQQ